MALLAPFFLYTLTVIIKIRLTTNQRILQFFFFLRQLLNLFRLWAPVRFERSSGCGSLFRVQTLAPTRRHKRLRISHFVLIFTRCQDFTLPLGLLKKTAP